VVDDAADEETRKTVESFETPRVRYVPHAQRTLTAGANNDGIRVSKGDVIILASDDLVFARDAIERFVRVLSSDPSIGWVGAVIYYRQPADLIQSAGTYFSPFARRLITIGQNTLDRGQLRGPYEVPIVDSCTAVPRRVLERTGLINAARFPFYHDLASIQFVARRLGYRVIIDPAIKASHDRPLEDRHSRALVSPLRSYYVLRSRIFLERGYDDSFHRTTFALSIPLYLAHFLLQTFAMSGVKFATKLSVATALLRGLMDGFLGREGVVIPHAVSAEG